MQQQQRVEYTHVTDHMVMHCVRLLATLGKFKVLYISNTTRRETPCFDVVSLRCVLATVILVSS
jgi:hypothetical protein